MTMINYIINQEREKLTKEFVKLLRKLSNENRAIGEELLNDGASSSSFSVIDCFSVSHAFDDLANKLDVDITHIKGEE